jgi:cation diffusion facilitator family transporter
MKKKQAALIAIIGGVAIFGIKLLAYFLSNSVALLSDALESTVNIAASVVMLFSVYMSEKPPDDSHNYGHQKVEEVSSMLEGLLIIAAAGIIIYAAAGRLFESTKLLELNLAIGVSMAATALNGGVSWFLGNTARKSGSAALEADSKHLLSDVISSVGVWIGLSSCS